MSDDNEEIQNEQTTQDNAADTSENTPTSDDDLAAAWENSMSDGDGEGGVLGDEGEKLLSQNEIDSLLGISPDTKVSGKNGLQQLLNGGNLYYERLPMLEVVFDRLVRLLSTTLRNFTGENVDVSIDSMTSVRFGDFMNSIPLPAMINIFRAKEWNDLGLVTIDSPLIYSIVDVLLGGRKGNALMRIEGRPYTTIERKLIQRMISVVLDDLRASFEPLCEIHFEVDRLETNPAFAAIARPGNAAVVASISIEMDERGGKINFLIPYSTLEPIRDLLLQTFMGEKFGQDSIWESHLEGQLWTTDFHLEAILGEATVPLSELLNLKKGSQILLNETPNSKTVLRCGDHTLFQGALGRKSGHIAIKIEEDNLTTEEHSHDKHAH